MLFCLFSAFSGPRGSYPTPFFGRLLFKITDPNHKTRYPKKGIGYEPLGRVCGPPPHIHRFVCSDPVYLSLKPPVRQHADPTYIYIYIYTFILIYIYIYVYIYIYMYMYIRIYTQSK